MMIFCIFHRLNCAVFPILLSLSRLSPSPLDDKESDSSLEVFIPLLKRFVYIFNTALLTNNRTAVLKPA